MRSQPLSLIASPLKMIGLQQESLFRETDVPRAPKVEEAVERLRSAGGIEERGAVFTSAQVVGAILDLCEYTPSVDLLGKRLLEPSFGGGDFLIPAVERLLAAMKARGQPPAVHLDRLGASIRAVELHRTTFDRTRDALAGVLMEAGLESSETMALLDLWLINDDYLLQSELGSFDVVVGNPPYVRQERIPDALLGIYRERFRTFVSRADLYVSFYEKGLLSLSEGGRLGFICANRWVRNKYGGALRSLIGRHFHLEYFIDLERADAFKTSVIAYPAITVLRRANPGATVLALGTRESSAGIEDLVPHLKQASSGSPAEVEGLARVDVVTPSTDPWLLDAPEVVRHLRALEDRFPPLEEAGARVTIGVATGADQVFIRPFDELPVEDSRKLPIAMAADCRDGVVEWGGLGVLNPYLPDGRLAPLDEFPRFKAYLESNESILRARHTARRNPDRWYKTIDRIYPDLRASAKLLIPDIKGDAAITYDPGEYYPHHNLYVVTGTDWDVHALMTLLRSSLALAFVAAYSPRMSGGFLRFQAQYLRRIRAPRWSKLPARHQELLVDAAFADAAECDAAVAQAFGLTKEGCICLQQYAENARVKGTKG